MQKSKYAHKAKNHFEANDLREDGFTNRKNNCDFHKCLFQAQCQITIQQYYSNAPNLSKYFCNAQSIGHFK